MTQNMESSNIDSLRDFDSSTYDQEVHESDQNDQEIFLNCVENTSDCRNSLETNFRFIVDSDYVMKKLKKAYCEQLTEVRNYPCQDWTWLKDRTIKSGLRIKLYFKRHLCEHEAAILLELREDEKYMDINKALEQEAAVDKQKSKNNSWQIKVEEFHKDILNILKHVFGKHKDYYDRGYECDKKKMTKKKNKKEEEEEKEEEQEEEEVEEKEESEENEE
ncbi:troponin T, skeletal muscle-like [Copidosoma floridanum]|uniref:troponin T, skeletal muscle-like n=1 Tax=Copidosoma floridanum TaxID=29053 RepID=UPI000C6F935A|nr:troponin T, skeletal muscle-like [Copidosoma floridanum]